MFNIGPFFSDTVWIDSFDIKVVFACREMTTVESPQDTNSTNSTYTCSQAQHLERVAVLIMLPVSVSAPTPPEQ